MKATKVSKTMAKFNTQLLIPRWNIERRLDL
jgi:hypothetical protein